MNTLLGIIYVDLVIRWPNILKFNAKVVIIWPKILNFNAKVDKQFRLSVNFIRPNKKPK